MRVSGRGVASKLPPAPQCPHPIHCSRAQTKPCCTQCIPTRAQVQRPGVVEAIGRDTYILRQLAGIARRQLKLNTDLPALVDEWAAR